MKQLRNTLNMELLEQRLVLTVGLVTHELSPLDPFPSQIAAFDVDNDGDLDLLADFDGQLVWHDNTDGLAAFSPEKGIGTTNGSRFELADLDGDGLTDVLVGNGWLRNLGTANFAAFETIPTATSALAQAADLDGDGDLDLVSRSDDGRSLSWLENVDGLGRFEHRETIEMQTSSLIAILIHVAP